MLYNNARRRKYTEEMPTEDMVMEIVFVSPRGCTGSEPVEEANSENNQLILIHLKNGHVSALIIYDYEH